MRPRIAAETSQTRDCRVVLRRVEGVLASELYLHCQPPAEAIEAGDQAEAIYRAVLDVLQTEGGGFGSVVREAIFLRDVRADLEAIRAGRERGLATSDAAAHRPATTEIEQPPLDESARLEVSIQAAIPTGTAPEAEVVAAPTVCPCTECARSHGLHLKGEAESRLHAGALYGAGADAYQQTRAMFEAAEGLLQRAGMTFRDVVRTWIHLREMDRDYASLNRGRRDFFESRGIDPPPASTGIGGGPVPDAHDLCLGLYAVKSDPPAERSVMTTPTLNEAPEYGADFVRGTRLVEANKVALHVSGTASIDEAGRTAHPGDFDAQVDRMLRNVASLLEGQGADFGDVVSAITYLKRPADAARLRQRLEQAGYAGFPNVLVEAPICRPELLCETEALAVLPRSAAPRSGPR